MKTAIVHLAGVSPLSHSRYHGTPKLEKESAADYEDRTWKEKAHYDKEGRVICPPMALKQCLDAAAQRSGKQIAGKGKSTYTKHFKQGVMVFEAPLIVDCEGKPYTRDNIGKFSGMMSSTGEKGGAGGKVVLRHFPDMPTWNMEATFTILDDVVTKDVFAEMIEEAGKFIGLGRFRPQNAGFYGRFAIEKIVWA